MCVYIYRKRLRKALDGEGKGGAWVNKSFLSSPAAIRKLAHTGLTLVLLRFEPRGRRCSVRPHTVRRPRLGLILVFRSPDRTSPHSLFIYFGLTPKNHEKWIPPPTSRRYRRYLPLRYPHPVVGRASVGARASCLSSHRTRVCSARRGCHLCDVEPSTRSVTCVTPKASSSIDVAVPIAHLCEGDDDPRLSRGLVEDGQQRERVLEGDAVLAVVGHAHHNAL